MLNDLLYSKYRIDFPVRWGKGKNVIKVVSYTTNISYDFVMEVEDFEKIRLKNFCDLLKQSELKAEKENYEEV